MKALCQAPARHTFSHPARIVAWALLIFTAFGGLALSSAHSSAATVAFSNPPSVSITGPADGASFTVPANITISAAASDSDGTVTKVEFFRGSTKLGEDATAPYAYTWKNVPAGTYILTAKATDNSGDATTSGPVNVTVNALPLPPNGSHCPDPSSWSTSDQFSNAGESITIPLDLAPCEKLSFNISWTNGPNNGGMFTLSLYNYNGQLLHERTYNGATPGSFIFPNEQVFNNPWRGTRSPEWLPSYAIFRVDTPFAAPANYTIGYSRTQRTGYNTGGSDFSNAPQVSLPATKHGSIHEWRSNSTPSDAGQFFKVQLAGNQAFYASGYAEGSTGIGAVYKVDLYDSAQQLITTNGWVNVSAYGRVNYNSGVFVNPSSSPADFYVRVRSTTWNVHDFELNLLPVSTEVTEVGFTGDHQITTWADGNAANQRVLDQPDGTEPTWKKTDNPNLPVAYTMGTSPKVFATLGINSTLPPNLKVALRVKKGTQVLVTRYDIPLSGASAAITNLSLPAFYLESPAGVKKADYNLTWEISYENWSKWTPIGGTGAHRVYWTHAAPLSPPFKNINETTFAPLYDKALDVATTEANGSATATTIATNINSAIARDLIYDPAESLGNDHPLTAYNVLRCLCADNANLLRGLLRSVGINATTYYVWGGNNTTKDRWFYLYGLSGGGSGTVTMRAVRPAIPSPDNLPANPHFTYHAVVRLGTSGSYYDPSYGTVGSAVTFDETLHFPTRTFADGTAAMSNQVISTDFVGSGNWDRDTADLFCPHSTTSEEPADFSSFISQTVPTTMVAGQTYNVSLTFRNTGSTTWSNPSYKLGSQTPIGNTNWGGNVVSLPGSVAPDDPVTINFSVTAPSTPGTYSFQWRMVREVTSGADWFGESSAHVSVTVTP